MLLTSTVKPSNLKQENSHRETILTLVTKGAGAAFFIFTHCLV